MQGFLLWIVVLETTCDKINNVISNSVTVLTIISFAGPLIILSFNLIKWHHTKAQFNTELYGGQNGKHELEQHFIILNYVLLRE